MGAVIVVGAQWGDEGKGKIVDLYSRNADLVVRYGGGANAGHTLVVDGQQLVTHLMPAGALQPGTQLVLGHGTVIDPAVLLEEIDALDVRGLFSSQRLTISERAHLVLPHHMLVDELRDQRAGSLGTTKRGIGPAYEDKVARCGLRVGDLLNEQRFRRKLTTALDWWRPTIEALGGTPPTEAATVERYLECGKRLAPYVGDAAGIVWNALQQGRRILLEGAQGTLLDVDSGTYPFVTSSSTVSGGACSGVGIGPTCIDAVVGIAKAYTTRVGNGPFPTELDDDAGQALREAGSEFGATTGRPRRCGWLDLPALRHAVRINGLSGIALTKIDVLTGLDEIKVCTGYRFDGKVLDVPPFDDLDEVEPVYASLPGWTEPLDACRRFEDLPERVREYVHYIEQAIECPAWLVSVGPDREQTIVVHDPFM
ncbi:MAG: adenylosuccinate synthase [Myxococcales bacterium]|nr:adenylosuccinate synthase [Myxococcales bacterium]MDD9965926.1 adenylosuccinate synthase [Myxococcales bacterium]